eukprot:Em0011g1155a
MTEEDGPRRVTRYSVRPPSRFVGKGADFRLWIQRVELYFREADVPRDKRGQELASLLDDEPFRIVSQMGLLRVDSGIDYAAVKECLEKQFAPSGLQLEWQRKFHTGRQEQDESLIAFSARLRMLVDKAYPSWPAEERLELVRNQFIHGILSSSIQLKLLQQNLDTLDAAVELACRLESVESAQSSFQTAKVAAGVTETRDGSEEGAQPGSGYQDLVAQVKSLSHQLDTLRRGKQTGPRSFRGPCWECGKPGHVGSYSGVHKVLVVRDMTQQCLLGTDFLEQCHCVINMGTRTLTMAGVKQQVPLLGGVRGIACHVAVQETTVIPPFHQVRLPVRLETDSDVFKDGRGLFEPKPVFSDDHSGLLVAHSVSYVSSQGDTVIQLMNVTSTPISVYAGEKASGNGQPVAARNAIDKSIGVLLSDTEGLTTGEREKLRSLLQTLGDVISVGDGDLGRTSVLRHKIDTGSALPIRQQSRRLPFHQRGVVKDMIDGMLKQGIIEPSEGAWASPIVLARKKDEADELGIVWFMLEHVYLDDIIIFSQTVDEHLQRLRDVLQRLKDAGLKIKPSKCQLLRKSVLYLGHIVSEKGVEVDPKKTSCVRSWQVPNDRECLRKFLGFASYYRKFIPSFAQIASPLHSLTEKAKPWQWSQQCNEAFDQLKEKLLSPPILSFPQFDKVFVVDTDASQHGLGAVLSQEVRCFRPYLWGRRFIVRTDHNSLQWLRNFKEPQGQVARWLDILAEYDFSVQHRPGLQHSNADALSRLPCKQCGLQTSTPPPGLPDAVKKGGSGDGAALCRKGLFVSCRLRTQNSYRTKTLICGRMGANACRLFGLRKITWCLMGLVIPRTSIQAVLKEFHDTPTGGHLGLRKTLEKEKTWAPMQSGLVGTPMQRVAMDILGPLPVTARENKYVLVVGDYFTKWVEAYPMPNMEAKTVAELFVNHFIARFGVPDVLHTDQGRNFESTLLKETCLLLGVQKTRTSPYHPQSDGLIERFNRTLLNMLSIAAVENERDWDLRVLLLMLAYRTSTQESTGCTPFYLMFGREARLPADVMFGLPLNFPPQQVNQYALDLRARLEGAYRLVRDHMGIQHLRQKTLDSPRKRTVVHFDRLKPCTVRSSEENVAPASNEKTRVPAGPRSVLNTNGELEGDRPHEEPEPLLVEVEIEGPRQAAEPHPVVIEPGRARPVRDRRKPDHYGHNIYDT